MKHTDLDGIRADILEDEIDLLGNKGWRDRFDPLYTEGVLRGERGYRRRRIAAKGRNRLDVCLNTCTAAGVRSGDNQNTPLHSTLL
mgnify:CR=1 FL=1